MNDNCSNTSNISSVCPNPLTIGASCITGSSVTTSCYQALSSESFQKSTGRSAQLNGVYVKGSKIGKKHSIKNWNGSGFQNLYAEKVEWEKISAKGAALNNVYIHGDLKDVQLNESTITNTTFSGDFADVDFDWASLNNVVFDGVKFGKRHFHRSNFDDATLENVSFQNSKLDRVTFKRAKLRNVVMPYSQIKNHAAFDGAQIYVCDRYVPLNGELLTLMGAYMDRHQRSHLNVSADWHAYHGM